MENKDTQVLLTLGERAIAEEIQGFLETYDIFTLLRSDNPASSVINTYIGSGIPETIVMHVNIDEYKKAIELISDSPYKDLIGEE